MLSRSGIEEHLGGLVAVLGLSPAERDEAFRRMLAAAPHQGSESGSVSLGDCLLGIADDPEMRESSRASEAGLAAAFSGRLDNLGNLARRFGLSGDPTPARVLIAAFHTLGEMAPNVLRGTFASAVTDGSRLWCFRDHVGLDRLFYRHDGRAFFLASEAKQVVAGAGIRKEPDVEIVERIFFAEDYDERRCALAGVERVPRSQLLLADRAGVRARRYWYPERLLETARMSPSEVAGGFDQLMSQAAARALTGHDVIALSGGIDSPAVAVYAAPTHQELSGKPLSALSEVYPDYPDCDELPYIEEVVEHLGMPLHTYVPGPQRLDRLEEWVELFDTPWQIWSPEGALERYAQARALGFRTILTGFVAEELMGGPRYLIPHYLWHGRLRALLRLLGMHKRRGTSSKWMIRQILSSFAPTRLVALHRLRHPLVFIPEWLDAGRVARNYARETVSPWKRWKAHQVGVFTGVGTSGEADRICQSWSGVRVRSPWADVDLWEFFLSLPAEVKIPNLEPKGLVRGLLRGKVPDAILDRRDKTVMNQWFEEVSTDYPTLRKQLVGPEHRLAGVDYEMLAQRVNAGVLELSEYLWAKDLATVHAFLAQW